MVEKRDGGGAAGGLDVVKAVELEENPLTDDESLEVELSDWKVVLDETDDVEDVDDVANDVLD